MTRSSNDANKEGLTLQPSVTRGGRARRQSSDRAPFSVEKVRQREDDAYFRLLERPEVSGPLSALERAQAVRDSVSRKLCGGSHAVTIDLLSQWENQLAETKAAMIELVHQYPLLAKHP
jgi:hypothetical protein